MSTAESTAVLAAVALPACHGRAAVAAAQVVLRLLHGAEEHEFGCINESKPLKLSGLHTPLESCCS